MGTPSASTTSRTRAPAARPPLPGATARAGAEVREEQELGAFALSYKRALRRATRPARAAILEGFYSYPRARRIVEAAAFRAGLADRVEEIRQEVAFLLHTRFIDTLLEHQGTPQQSYSLLYAVSGNACRTLRKNISTEAIRHLSLDDDHGEGREQLLEQVAAAAGDSYGFNPELVEARIDLERAGAELARRLARAPSAGGEAAADGGSGTESHRAGEPDAHIQAGQPTIGTTISVPEIQAPGPERPGQDPKPESPAAPTMTQAAYATAQSAQSHIARLPEHRVVASILGLPPLSVPGSIPPKATLLPPLPRSWRDPWGMMELPMVWSHEEASVDINALELPLQVLAIHTRWADRVPYQEVKGLIDAVKRETGRGPRDLASALGIGPTAWLNYAKARSVDIPSKVVESMRTVLARTKAQSTAIATAKPSEPLSWQEVELLPITKLLDYWGRLLAGDEPNPQERDLLLCKLFSLKPLSYTERWRKCPPVTLVTLDTWRSGVAAGRTLAVADREALHAIVLAQLEIETRRRDGARLRA